MVELKGVCRLALKSMMSLLGALSWPAALSDTLQDPTRPAGAWREPETQTSESLTNNQEAAWVLQQIIKTDEGYVVVINGKAYRPDDPNDHFEILRVQPDAVLIRHSGQEQWLKQQTASIWISESEATEGGGS